jgi:hypothetical protein
MEIVKEIRNQEYQKGNFYLFNWIPYKVEVNEKKYKFCFILEQLIILAGNSFFRAYKWLLLWAKRIFDRKIDCFLYCTIAPSASFLKNTYNK